ncbi:helix-turn-helix domain-containing protein [Enhygromyxa salina]|uniref:helix-turn-helix domain-containing protein n=1 Tax=Enhygromyxa salina TaxID=215803 RepID=UPI0015E66315|nr:helix-turn-helix transcriptional regulator [Enhygromyxa salina]
MGRHLRDLRLALNLEIEQLTERCRLDAEVIHALERGEHPADLDTLTELAGGLGIPLHMIFTMWEAQALEDSGGDETE